MTEKEMAAEIAACIGERARVGTGLPKMVWFYIENHGNSYPRLIQVQVMIVAADDIRVTRSTSGLERNFSTMADFYRHMFEEYEIWPPAKPEYADIQPCPECERIGGHGPNCPAADPDCWSGVWDLRDEQIC